MVATLSLARVPSAGQARPAHSAAAAAIAQAAGPADCVTALSTFVPKRQQEVQPPTGLTLELFKQVNEEKAALAKSCLERYDAATIKPSQLADPSELYCAAGQPEEGPATGTRARAAAMPA